MRLGGPEGPDRFPWIPRLRRGILLPPPPPAVCANHNGPSAQKLNPNHLHWPAPTLHAIGRTSGLMHFAASRAAYWSQCDPGSATCLLPGPSSEGGSLEGHNTSVINKVAQGSQAWHHQGMKPEPIAGKYTRAVRCRRRGHASSSLGDSLLSQLRSSSRRLSNAESSVGRPWVRPRSSKSLVSQHVGCGLSHK